MYVCVFCLVEGAGFTLTSLILLHQLEDKMKAHRCLMDFLLQVPQQTHKLWDTLSSSSQYLAMLFLSVRSTDRSSRPPHFHRGAHVPDGHAALAMWTCGEALGHHRAEEPSCQASRAGEHGHPVSTEEEQHRHTVQPHACRRVLQRGARLQQTGMKNICIFLCFISCLCLQVSQISSIFECLLDEEEKALKEHSDAARWAEVVLNVNDIVKVHSNFHFHLFINSCTQNISNHWARN